MFFKAESTVEIVQTFARIHYPDLTLQPKMFEQLSWLQNNSVNTSQSDVQSKDVAVNIEVKRILSRLYCLRLIIDGKSFAYSAFVQAQTEDLILREDNFQRLSLFIKELTPASLKCLEATCFITKSDQAIRAVPKERRGELPADSEQFITHMVTHFPTLLPICAELNQEAVDLLPYAFYKNSHARHILDMEGGYNMVSSIAEALAAKEITHEQYNLWFARWIINIAGLDGHINHKGSIYLTEPVANCIWALKSELDQLWLNPNHPVIDNYLDFRAKQLKVNDNYIAYLGALMRQYSPTKGFEIQVWFDSLDKNKQQEKIQAFKTYLEQTKVTPSYKPTVLANLLQLGTSVADTLSIFTEIEFKAMQIYSAAIANGSISENTPLSYRNVAFKESLLAIKNYYDSNYLLPELTINTDGNLIVAQEALLKEENTIKSGL